MNKKISQHPLLNNIYWKPLVAVVVWGFSFIATKYALNEVKPVSIVFLRQLFGISFLVAIAYKQKMNFAVKGRDFSWVLLLGALTTLHLWIQVTGLQWTSASNTGWIIGITPVLMAILGFIFFKEKILGQQIAGILISFFGLLLLVGKGDLGNIDLIQNKGDLLIVASSFTWAVYSIVSKRATINCSPLITTFYLLLIMAVVTAPFTLNTEDINKIINLSFNGWMAIIFLGIFCSGVGYYLWARALSEMSASRAGAFLYLEPFVTFFFATIMLNENVTLITFLSGLIIIAGVILVNRK